MTLPRFTAETSLYHTSSHYQTAKQVFTFSVPTTMHTINPVMFNTGGVNCGNCVGGDCAELHCFENWVQNGAPPGGPYQEGMENQPFPGGGPVGSGDDPPPRPRCRIECSRILIYDPATKTTREEVTCVRKCEAPILV